MMCEVLSVRTLRLAVGAVLLAALGGCGGGSSSAAPDPQPAPPAVPSAPSPAPVPPPTEQQVPLGVTILRGDGTPFGLAAGTPTDEVPIGTDAAGNLIVRAQAGSNPVLRKYDMRGARVPFGTAEELVLADPLANGRIHFAVDPLGRVLVSYVRFRTQRVLDWFTEWIPVSAELYRIGVDGAVTRLFAGMEGDPAPLTLAADAVGSIYFTDATPPSALRKRTEDGAIVEVPTGSIANHIATDFDPELAPLAASPGGTVYLVSERLRAIAALLADGTSVALSGRTSREGSIFTAPRFPATDAAGDLYVADAFLVRKVTPAGVVTSVVGPRNTTFLGLAGGAVQVPLAGLYPGQGQTITGLAVRADGVIFIRAAGAILRARLE